MWDMAVTLEDGNMSERSCVRQAQEALRQALERGATDEEIKRLPDQLRAALDKFLQALASRPAQPAQLARPLDRYGQMRPQDLKNMIDRMEQRPRTARGRRPQLLQNCNPCSTICRWRSRQMQDGDSDDEMMNQLNELGELIQRQQQLRDPHLPAGGRTSAAARPARAA